MTENKSVVSCRWGRGMGTEGWMTKGHRENLGGNRNIFKWSLYFCSDGLKGAHLCQNSPNCTF